MKLSVSRCVELKDEFEVVGVQANDHSIEIVQEEKSDAGISDVDTTIIFDSECI